MAELVIEGTVRVWGITDKKRRYIDFCLPHGQARVRYQSEEFDIQTGKGEQRVIKPAYANRLKREIENATFVPCTSTVGTRPKHRKRLVFLDQGDHQIARLILADDDHLPLINGGHRFEALEIIRRKWEHIAKTSKVESERAEAARMIQEIDKQPISAIILLDGNTQEDFIHLNITKAVDAAHILSLRVTSNAASQRDVQGLSKAFDTARLLNDNNRSPFYMMIRFDSQGMAPLPVTSLCQKSDSDLSTSLVGLARLGGLIKMNESALAGLVITCGGHVKKHAPELMANGRILTPPPNGNKASAGMVIGLAIAMLGRLILLGKKQPDESDLTRLLLSCQDKLDYCVDDMDRFAGSTKRRLLGDFVRDFYADIPDLAMVNDLPKILVDTLAASAYGYIGKRGRKPKDYVPFSLDDLKEMVPA